MSVANTLRKRRFWPVVIDGETIHIRALLMSEIHTVDAFRDEEESVGYVLGCTLLNEDKSPAYTPSADESPKQFGARVMADLDLPLDTKSELLAKISKLSDGPPKPDDLKKN